MKDNKTKCKKKGERIHKMKNRVGNVSVNVKLTEIWIQQRRREAPTDGASFSHKPRQKDKADNEKEAN